MLSLSQNEPSALLSNARLTIATLIQRPSTITTSNAFDEFSILDNLIDVSNDVDRFEDGENRKFLNIAQLITASTCIYSRRVDALYKLINTFQSTSSSSQNKHDKSISDEDDEQQLELIINHEQKEDNQLKKPIQEKKKKLKDINHSFICNDLTKISLNPTKNFFCNRTSLFDLKFFQKYIPIGNKQFWLNDNQPIIFDLIFDNNQLFEIKQDYQQQQSERLIDALNKHSPVKSRPIFDDNDIPLPISTYDDDNNHQESLWNNEKLIEKKKLNRNRIIKKFKNDIDLNIFRNGLTDKEQALFHFQKFKPLINKIKIEQTQFFIKKFNRKHFDELIKDCPSSITSLFIYPTITIHHLTIRERYSIKIDQTFSRIIRSPSIPICDVLDENSLIPLSTSSPIPSFIPEINDDDDDDDDDIQDVDIRLQTDMEQILDAAIYNSNEEQEHNKIFLELRSSIMSYMNKHNSIKQTNVDDLLDTLNDNYSLPLVFSQLLHLCASTQRYHLHSTSNDNLFIEKIVL